MKTNAWMSLLFIFFVAALSQAHAEDFYRDKRVRLIVAYPPGGGYDTYGRALARYLGRHIPGNPSIIVQNMPGGGSVIGANYGYKVAPSDGTAIISIGPSILLLELVGGPGIEFESDRFNWLVAANSGGVIACIANANAGVRTLDDAINRDKPLVMGGSAPGAQTIIWPTAYRDILRANIKVISGYPGTAPIRAAMEREEIDGGCWSWDSVKVTAKDMLDAGRAVVFSQIGVQKAPDLDVENALGRARTKEDRLTLEALLSEMTLARPYLAPPRVPGERVRLLREAFMSMLKDAEFLREADRMRLDINPLLGEEAQKVVVELRKSPPEIVDRLRRILGK